MRRLATALIIVAVGILAVAVSFGVAQQPPGRQAAPPPGFVAEPEIYFPLPASTPQYGTIDGKHLKQYANQWVAFARKPRDAGNQFYGILVGTPSDTEAANWIETQFKRIGLEVRRQEVVTPSSWSGVSWDVSAVGGGKTVKFSSVSPITNSPGTPPGGLDLEAVWVGAGMAPDFAGRDVRGKAAVVYSFAVPGLNSAATNGAMRRAYEHGAAAIIVILAIPGNVSGTGIPGQGVVAPAGGTAAPPQIMMGLQDGTALQELIEQAKPGQPVRVHLRVETLVRKDVKASMVIGVLPGRTDENIYIGAHRDSWYDGGQDNASSIAMFLGLAEYFAKVPREQRRRTMTFVSTPEHHSGSNGSEFVHENWKPFLAKTALIINCEHSAVNEFVYWPERGSMTLHKTNGLEATRLFVNGSAKLKSLVTKNLAMFGVATWLDPVPGSSGDLSPLQWDAPAFHVIGRGIYFHTTGDTADVVPAAGIETVTRAHAKIIDDVNTLDLKDLLPTPAAPAVK
jgi:hypothetical protein